MGDAPVKSTAIVSARSVRFCACAALLALAAPLAAHPAGEYLPETDGAVTLIVPDKLKDAPFLPDTKDNPLFLVYDEILKKLEAKHVRVTVHALAKYDEGILLNSTASPATVRYILKYKVLGDDIAWTESGDTDNPVFNLTVPDSGAFRITFPAKDWLLFAVNAPPAPVDDTESAKPAPASKKEPSSSPAVSAASLLKALPDDSLLALVWPEPGATAEYPLLGELKGLSFHIVRNASDKRPIHAEIAMPAKTDEAALKLKKACQDKFDEVYRNAEKEGTVPDELVNAFTVVREDAKVTVHILLPDDMAKYMFSQFATALQDEIRPFIVPDKLK